MEVGHDDKLQSNTGSELGSAPDLSAQEYLEQVLLGESHGLGESHCQRLKPHPP
jgi:hypothetical protein